MFAQQLTRNLTFAGSTAAQGIEECEKFVEEAVALRCRRNSWVQRMKAGATLLAMWIRPYRR
jgi:hypothetical protein